MRHFEKSYRSVELINAVTLGQLYAGAPNGQEISEELWYKIDDTNRWIDKHAPGFVVPIVNKKIRVFFAKHFCGRLFFSLNMRKQYQKILNYLYDNFLMEELNLIYSNYLANGEPDSKDAIRYITYFYNRI